MPKEIESDHQPGSFKERRPSGHYNAAMSFEADHILARVASAYAGCRSYRDEGVVTTTFYNGRKLTERRPFSTRFVRPDGFLFEFRSRRGEDDWDQYAIWNENGQTRSWWSIRPGLETVKRLDVAIGGATGVSGGSAFRVPHLLMPTLGSRSAPGPACVIASPEASNLNCVVVEIPQHLGGVEQIWIEETSFLVRKVVEPRHVLEPPPVAALDGLKSIDPALAEKIERSYSKKSERPEVDTVTTYEPVFDVEIARADLVFVPPSE